MEGDSFQATTTKKKKKEKTKKQFTQTTDGWCTITDGRKHTHTRSSHDLHLACFVQRAKQYAISHVLSPLTELPVLLSFNFSFSEASFGGGYLTLLATGSGFWIGDSPFASVFAILRSPVDSRFSGGRRRAPTVHRCANAYDTTRN